MRGSCSAKARGESAETLRTAGAKPGGGNWCHQEAYKRIDGWCSVSDKEDLEEIGGSGDWGCGML